MTMYRKAVLTVACLLIGTGTALGSTFTYTSAPLQVGNEGGNGATQVVISFTGNSPTAGKCVLTQKVKSYDDGAHTLRSLKSDGYILTKTIKGDDKKIKVTYANVCLGKDGLTFSGQYQIYFSYSEGIVYGWFIANNLAYSVPGDDVELDLYFGGETPQVYSNYSNVQGTWVITP